MTTPAPRTHIPWICHLKSGADLSGSEKALIVENMLSIAKMLTDGLARVEPNFERDAVVLRFWPQLDRAVIEATIQRGCRESRGFMGVLARLMLLRHGRWVWGHQQLAALIAEGHLERERQRVLDIIDQRISEGLAFAAHKVPSIRIG